MVTSHISRLHHPNPESDSGIILPTRLQVLFDVDFVRPSNFTFTFHFHALEEEMATHSSVLAWRITGTVGPGGLPSLESHRVGHD